MLRPQVTLMRYAALTAVWHVALNLAVMATTVLAEPISISESTATTQGFSVKLNVQTEGSIRTAGAADDVITLPLQGQATFAFLERRLSSAGRDALAFRSVREFTLARMQTRVEGYETKAALPPSSRFVVASGSREGIVSYSLNTLLTRDLVELLELPADPLTLAALLPSNPVEIGDTWKVSEWAAQMVTGIEAISSTKLQGKLVSIDTGRAKLELSGEVQGLRHGSRTGVSLSGNIWFDTSNSTINESRLTYSVSAEPGSVSPGIQARAVIAMTRTPAADTGPLTDELIAKIPVTPPDAALGLFFDAGPWNARLRHSRNWHLFQAVFDREPGVAILRLVSQGSLIAQCNLSPIPSIAPGETTPVADYEKDIRTSLGASLEEITARDNTSLPDGRTLTRVIAKGNTKVSAEKSIPMEWRYYICTNGTGQRMSFVFAVESTLSDSLGSQDRELVESLQFLPPQQAQKP